MSCLIIHVRNIVSFYVIYIFIKPTFLGPIRLLHTLVSFEDIMAC
jgi:hypothetical protein